MRTFIIKFSDYKDYDFNDLVDITQGVIISRDIRDFNMRRFMEFLRYNAIVRPLAKLLNKDILIKLGYPINEFMENDELFIRALIENGMLEDFIDRLGLLICPFDDKDLMVVYNGEKSYQEIYNIVHELGFYLVESDEFSLYKVIELEKDVLTDEIMEALLDNFDIFDDDEILLDLDDCEYLRNDTGYEVI